MITLEQALDTIMQLPVDQREILIDVIRNRDIENRRKEIAKEARESLTAFRSGKFTPKPVEEIITELRQALDERD